MKKVFKIIAFTLLALCGIAYLLCYIFLKEQTTYFTECLIDFINRPLPIIGVSTLVVLAFVYRCFVATKYGKKAISEFKEENDQLKHEIEQQAQLLKTYEEMSKNALNQAKNDVDKIREYIIKGFELSKNIKVKEIANKLRGVGDEETTNSDTKTKEI